MYLILKKKLTAIFFVCVEKTAQECANTEKEKDIPDRGAEALDFELRKCVSTTSDHKIKQLLKVTLELRNS